jgi:hypothetical protein
MSTLLEIADERAVHLTALEDLLFEVGGDVTDEEAAAAIDAWLAEADAPLKQKLDAYASVIRERELKAAARKAEADRVAALARTDANAVARLKERLKYFFESEGLQKIETDRFKFSISGNGGLAPVIVHVDPEQLPEWAQRKTVTADIEAIRGEIETRKATGKDPLPFAEIGPRGTHLRVR